LIGKWDKGKRMGSRSHLTQFLALIIISNTMMGFYFSRIHKRGVVHTIEWLREEAYKGHVSSIVFLMPCHSTPYYSHIHLDIPMRYITCEPPLGYVLLTHTYPTFLASLKQIENIIKMKLICFIPPLPLFSATIFQSKLEIRHLKGLYTLQEPSTRFQIKIM
jgi:hypothetical protein